MVKVIAVREHEILQALYRTKSRANLETQLVQSVIEHLTVVMGFRAYRRNVGGREWIDAEGKVRLVKYNETGMADVWAIGPRGIHIEVECKSPKVGPTRTLTSEQKAWLEECAEAGAIAICVSSLSELSAKLRHEFQKRGLIWKSSWTLD